MDTHIYRNGTIPCFNLNLLKFTIKIKFGKYLAKNGNYLVNIRLVLNFYQNFTKILPNFYQNFTKFLPKFYQKFTKFLPNFYQNFTKIADIYGKYT